MVSQESLNMKVGDTISFDWRAQGGSDAYDVYAYLLNVDTGETVKDRCEPCHIAQVAEVLAAAKGMDERELVDACYDNAARLFFPEERR